MQYPFIGNIQLSFVDFADGLISEIHHDEPGSIIDLVAEIPCSFDLFGRVTHIGAGSGTRGEAESQRVNTVLPDYLEGVNAVAEGFAHLASELITHHAVNINGMEGYIAHRI